MMANTSAIQHQAAPITNHLQTAEQEPYEKAYLKNIRQFSGVRRIDHYQKSWEWQAKDRTGESDNNPKVPEKKKTLTSLVSLREGVWLSLIHI